MGRTLKPQQVDEVRHDGLGVVVPVMLDRNTLTFFAKVGDEIVRGDSAKIVANETYHAIERRAELDWIPIVRVTLPSAVACHFCKVRGIDVNFERFYLAEAGANVLELRWIDYEREQSANERLTRARRHHGLAAPLKLPHRLERDRVSREHASVIHRYTPELWAGLEQLAALMGEAERRLHDLVMTDAGLATLVAAGAGTPLLLTSGIPEEQHQQDAATRPGAAKPSRTKRKTRT